METQDLITEFLTKGTTIDSNASQTPIALGCQLNNCGFSAMAYSLGIDRRGRYRRQYTDNILYNDDRHNSYDVLIMT